jgi:hypothetical protein
MSKIDLIRTPPFGVATKSPLRRLGRAAGLLLRALQDSRVRSARKAIQDYRHLLGEQASSVVKTGSEK